MNAVKAALIRMFIFHIHIEIIFSSLSHKTKRLVIVMGGISNFGDLAKVESSIWRVC